MRIPFLSATPAATVTASTESLTFDPDTGLINGASSVTWYGVTIKADKSTAGVQEILVLGDLNRANNDILTVTDGSARAMPAPPFARPRLLRPSRSLIPAALLLGVILASPNAAKALEHSWTGKNGQWNWGSWTNGVPTSSGTAMINNGGTVSLPDSTTGSYRHLRVGTASGGAGGVQVNGGVLSGTNAYLGDVSGATGSATVTSGTWTNTSVLNVGYYGTGTLKVDGGTVTSTVGVLGDEENSYGSATVTSGTWRNTGSFYVGFDGTGTLTVDGGTVITSGTVLLGAARGYGSATVTSGTWSNEGDLSVGHYGTGILTVNGGTVTSKRGNLGLYPNGHGSVTVTSGTWSNESSLFVGFLGTGTLTVNGGTVTNTDGYLGYSDNSHGSATVTSGMWLNGNNFYVGRSSTGTLTVDGGLVRVSGTTFTGATSSGNGTITLSGDEEGRGVLETGVLAKGEDASTIATGKVHFDGGIIRALANREVFFLRYAAGDITIHAGGAFIDTNGYSIGISTDLGGTGALNKLGEGALTLGGSNSYSGGTFIHQGTLIAASNFALGTGNLVVSGGTFSVAAGVTPANSIALNGGSMEKALEADTSLVDAINVSSSLGGTLTRARLLDGTASAETTLQASFGTIPGATNDSLRIGAVFSFSGVPILDADTGETDRFVLQLQVDDLMNDSRLGWFDSNANAWVNAVDGNIGESMPIFVGNKAYNTETDFVLGYYGVDLENGTVWAVLNHNSDFAVVPEPSTWALLLGTAAALRLRRRNRQNDNS